MEKRLTAFFMFAALLFAPFALVGCGEEIQVPDNPNNEETENPIDGNATVFSSSVADLIPDDGTRTSMNAKRKFFWEPGDAIWLDEAKDGSFTTKLTESKLSADKASASFYLRGKILNGDKYDILYTGNDTTTQSPFSVTIAKEQTQTKWNNAEHFGESGDCGVAEATPNGSGKYNFVVKHKAAYLMLAPYLNSAIRDDENCRLKKIEIISNNTIAGTYPFNSTNGIVTNSTITNPSDTIKLHCEGGENDFKLSKTSSDTCFVVIQPGTHTLTIKYTITSSLTPDETFTFEQDAFTKDFKVNGVTTIRHELTPLVFTGYYYRWGAANRYYHPNWDNTTTAPTQLTSTMWKDLPNANEVYSYVFYGDPRFDHEQPWILNCDKDFSGKLGKRGVWVKKRAYCSQFSATLAIGLNQDLRNYQFTKIPNTSTSFRTGGRPDKSVIDQYFFLPCCGHYHWETGGNFTGWNSSAGMWAKSPRRYDGNPTEYAIHLSFALRSDADGLPEIAVNTGNRLNGIIAAPSWIK